MYTIDCPICDITTEIVIKYNGTDDEVPRHCPMCGSDNEATCEED